MFGSQSVEIAEEIYKYAYKEKEQYICLTN